MRGHHYINARDAVRVGDVANDAVDDARHRHAGGRFDRTTIEKNPALPAAVRQQREKRVAEPDVVHPDRDVSVARRAGVFLLSRFLLAWPGFNLRTDS